MPRRKNLARNKFRLSEVNLYFTDILQKKISNIFNFKQSFIPLKAPTREPLIVVSQIEACVEFGVYEKTKQNCSAYQVVNSEKSEKACCQQKQTRKQVVFCS